MLINQQIQSENVDNPLDFLPSVTVDDMITLMRVDKTQGSPRIASYISHAYDEINRMLPETHSDGSYLDTLTYVKLDEYCRTYKRAVLHEAAALMADDYSDYDSTGAGVIRGDNQATKSDKLRRIVNHCIADLTNKPRNRISLL